MSRARKDPLRPLTEAETAELLHVSQSFTDEASRVAHAKELLAVAEGKSYAEAAKAAGRHSYHSVSMLVTRFNEVGIEALTPGHGGGRTKVYDDAKKKRILDEFKRTPDRKNDGTSVWSIDTLKNALRKADNGLPDVSHETIWETLREAGYTWQKDRSWCVTGTVLRKRKDGVVEITDVDKDAKKNLSRKPIHKRKASVSTSGARTKRAHSRQGRAPVKSGAQLASLVDTRTSMSEKVPQSC